ncbi:MAG TPA: hypothetical protein EYN96_12980 [Candidatus Hydrogenedentes bacterium]|nr:hypothetical protein [Candidatus Hydrogenedentota bacterium]
MTADLTAKEDLPASLRAKRGNLQHQKPAYRTAVPPAEPKHAHRLAQRITPLASFHGRASLAVE